MITQDAKPATSESRSTDVFGFLAWLQDPGDVFEVRCFNCPESPNSKWTSTASGWFDDYHAAADAVSKLESLNPEGIYVTLNPTNRSLLARRSNRIEHKSKITTTDHDIDRRRWLFIDIDPVRPSKVSSTADELASADELADQIRDALTEQGWTNPIKCMSGNGYYLLYRVDLPNDDDALSLVKGVLTALHERFSNANAEVDTTSSNAARVLKAIGTMARKGDNFTPENRPESEHRPHRRSWFETPGTLPQPVTPEQLRIVAGWTNNPESNPQKPPHTQSSEFDVGQWIQAHNIDVGPERSWNGTGRRWILKDSPLCTHDADGAAFIAVRDSGAIVAGCHHNHCTWNWRDLREYFEPERILAKLDDGTVDLSQLESGNPGLQNLVKPHKNEGSVDRRPQSEPYKRFPSHVLPAPLSDLVQEGAKAIGCDESYIALPLLSCVGAAIGNTTRVVVKKGWNAPPSVWTMIVGESGTAKSPAFKTAKSPIQRHQRNLLEQHAAAVRTYEQEKAEYDAAMKARKKSPTPEPEPEQPQYPHAERCMVSDTTVEALAPILKHNPRGILLQRDELNGWLGSFNQYKAAKGADESHWLSMFDGESITVDRKGEGTLPTYVETALVSITGGIQPAILAKSMGKEHRASGMASRFLIASPPRRAQQWTDDEVSEATQLLVDRLFIKLFAIEFADGVSQPHFVGMSADAKQVFQAYFNEHHTDQANLTGDMSAAWSKLIGYVPRLALLFHIVDQTAVDADITQSISAETVKDAIRLVEWFKSEAGRLYASIDDTDEERQLVEIADWIKRKHNGECTPSQIVQGIKHVKTVDDAELAAHKLIKSGLAVWDVVKPGASGGQPKRVIQII